MNIIKKLGIQCFLFSTICQADFFSVPLLDARWELIEESTFCRLKQDIPRFGTSDFTQYTGEKLRFSISENRYKSAISEAVLSVDTPVWNHQSIVFKEYPLFLDEEINDDNLFPRLSVYGDEAELMLDAVAKGLAPTITYKRTIDRVNHSLTKVAISPINFYDQYVRFTSCRKNFLPYGFKNSLEKSMFFRAKSKSLSPPVLTQLKNTVRYLSEVDNARVYITSETEIGGNSDKVWFKKRADVLVAKLMEFGASKDKIKISRKSGIPKNDKNAVDLRVFGPDSLNLIRYRKGNVKLTRTEKKRLDVLLRYANEFLPNSTLVIKSHTDSKGSRAVNLKVSQKRGDVIRDYLISQGMNSNKVKVKAYGESRPITINRFERGRAKNRRVELGFIG